MMKNQVKITKICIFQNFQILSSENLGKYREKMFWDFKIDWNEAFWSLMLTSTNSAPLSVFIASFSSPEGLFWAKLSAASVMAVLPIMILGWFSQKQLVAGLTFGAIK